MKFEFKPNGNLVVNGILLRFDPDGFYEIDSKKPSKKLKALLSAESKGLIKVTRKKKPVRKAEEGK